MGRDIHANARIHSDNLEAAACAHTHRTRIE